MKQLNNIIQTVSSHNTIQNKTKKKQIKSKIKKNIEYGKLHNHDC